MPCARTKSLGECLKARLGVKGIQNESRGLLPGLAVMAAWCPPVWPSSILPHIVFYSTTKQSLSRRTRRQTIGRSAADGSERFRARALRRPRVGAAAGQVKRLDLGAEAAH